MSSTQSHFCGHCCIMSLFNHLVFDLTKEIKPISLSISRALIVLSTTVKTTVNCRLMARLNVMKKRMFLNIIFLWYNPFWRKELGFYFLIDSAASCHKFECLIERTRRIDNLNVINKQHHCYKHKQR